MPQYDFLNQKTGEIKTLFFHMNDKKEYSDDSGYQWVRQFSKPQASIDNNWDENNPRDFIEKSGRKRGNLGNLQDKAKELSIKRQEKYGVDIVKEKMYADYSKKRDGKIHPQKRKENLEKIKKTPIDLKIK